jgi:rubrerythrin
METTSILGKNRTGMLASPGDSDEMLESSMVEAVPTTSGDERSLAQFRMSLMRDADILGSVPPPPTLKGVMKSGIDMVKGHRPQTLIDKMAERLAFERTSVRLYEALITKHELKADELSAVSAARLAEIRTDESQHFALLVAGLQQLGADPTAQTPCADVAGVEAMGLLQVITDARTTFAQSLHAILVAELADNDGWDMLIELAELGGHQELAAQFRQALTAEETHLDQVRAWLRELVRGDARVMSSLS